MELLCDAPLTREGRRQTSSAHAHYEQAHWHNPYDQNLQADPGYFDGLS